MRIDPLKTLDLILSRSKDEANISCYFSDLLARSSEREKLGRTAQQTA